MGCDGIVTRTGPSGSKCLPRTSYPSTRGSDLSGLRHFTSPFYIFPSISLPWFPLRFPSVGAWNWVFLGLLAVNSP